MNILDKKSEEVVSFFSALDEMLDNIRLALENQAMSHNKLLTGKEVCNLLHISSRTLQDWRDTGKIPFVKIGGKVLYDQTTIMGSIKETSS